MKKPKYKEKLFSKVTFKKTQTKLKEIIIQINTEFKKITQYNFDQV